MGEKEPPHGKPGVPQFGEQLPSSDSRSRHHPTTPMFQAGDDLPLFSGTAIPVTERPFVPQDHTWKQATLPEMPGIDYGAVLARDKELYRRRRPGTSLPPAADLFTPLVTSPTPPVEAPQAPAVQRRERARKRPHPEEGHQLREALAPYVNLPLLRDLAAHGGDVYHALTDSGEFPAEVLALLEVYKLLFRPTHREQIKSPADVAALLMADMGYLEQEQMKVVCLNTKNRLQKVHLVYQGSLNSSLVRVGEIFREPIKLNSAAVIISHNHPSGDPAPSPEDVLVTREIVAAGKLLDVEVLDHLVIGQGRWVSMRERGLGFEKG